MPLINEDEFDRPNDQFRPSPFRSAGPGMAFDPNFAGVEYAHSEVDQPEPEGFIADGAVDSDQLADGAVIPRTIDATPPDVPTGLALSSTVATDADGRAALVLVVDVTQPPDTDLDLYGTQVQITAAHDGNEPTPAPDWDYPRTILIPKGSDRALVDGIIGATRYWARARSIDNVGNPSAWIASVTTTSGRDTVAPDMPEGFSATAAFRGFFANWSPVPAPDLMFNQLRYALDDGTGLAPDTDHWQTLNVRTSGVFVGNLEPGTIYWTQVRAVDFSGNVVTSLSDATAVDYLANPEAGWTAMVPVTPNLIGAADVAFNSVLANIIAANSIDADTIQGGTLRIAPAGPYANGIEVLAADLTVIGLWDENGLKVVDPTDPTRYLLISAGEVRFTVDDGATFPTAITPEGINASAINLGALPGGHNLVLNSSFELADFAAAASTLTFTTSAQWAAGNRVTAPVNITEGATALTITTPGYV
jgi:hypothetical protein